MPLHTIRATTTTLANGLRVVAVPMPRAGRVVLDARLPAGPLYETPETNGVSHFLEHMLYRGVPGLPTAHELSVAIETRGGSLEAATYVDHGALVLSAPREHFEALLAIYADVFQRPVMSDLAVEREIVREEILEELDDEGRQIDADNLVRAAAFEAHPLGMSITGEAEQLGVFDEAALRTHHRRHYVARATVIAVAGALDPEAATAAVARAFAALPKGRVPAAPKTPTQEAPRVRHVANVSSQTSLRVALRAPASRDPREPAMELLLRTLDDGMATRLYARLCDELGLCYDVGAVYEAHRDAGLVTLGVETQHSRVARVFDEVLDVLQRLREEGPSQAELDKAKARHRWQLLDLTESPQDVAEYCAAGVLMGGGRDPAERQALLDAVTLAEVRAAAETFLTTKGLTALTVGEATSRTQERITRRLERFG